MRFHPVEIIAKKRDRQRLSAEEIRFFVHGLLNGTVRDYQAAAWLMAVYLNGMDEEETLALTEAMLTSGRIIDLSQVPGLKVDKHSTGGVGDKVTLLLVPIVAAAGVPVPTISGRGLGHTGGTLDKLESIPGFRTRLTIEEYLEQMRTIGAAMIGQTDDIAPADRELYALRDVTATVESIPLIAASIMSKKLAEGIDALVLDVKVGRGAFMKTRDRARELARTLVAIGRGAGKRTVALLTDMDTPLGRTIGNWLEVEEAIACLRGQEVPDVLEVTYELAAWMFYLAERVRDIEEGRALAREMVRSGQAWEKLLQIVRAQGGDVRLLEHPERYPEAPCVAERIRGRSGRLGFRLGGAGTGSGSIPQRRPHRPQSGHTHQLFARRIRTCGRPRGPALCSQPGSPPAGPAAARGRHMHPGRPAPDAFASAGGGRVRGGVAFPARLVIFTRNPSGKASVYVAAFCACAEGSAGGAHQEPRGSPSDPGAEHPGA
jgi:pyrimidine-nucleoside phosphorylase